MAKQLTLDVKIVDYAGEVWSGIGSYVAAPTTSGPVGIYPRHQPMLALLSTGEMKVEQEDGSLVKAEVSGGFLSVDSDLVTIVTDKGALI